MSVIPLPSSVSETTRGRRAPQPSTGELLRSFVTDPTLRSGLSASRFFEDTIANHEPDDLISPAEATTRYGHLGLTFDSPVSAELAQTRADRKRAEIIRQNIINRSNASPVTKFGLAALAAFTDPLNVAAGFVPVIREGRLAKYLSTLPAVRANAARGAIEGAVGNALIEPLVLAQARADQAEYDGYDALLNIVLGAGIGSTLRAAGTPIERYLSARAFETRAAAAETAVRQLAQGRRVNVEPVFRLETGRTFAEEAQAREPFVEIPVVKTPGEKQLVLRNPKAETPEIKRELNRLEKKGEIESFTVVEQFRLAQREQRVRQRQAQMRGEGEPVKFRSKELADRFAEGTPSFRVREQNGEFTVVEALDNAAVLSNEFGPVRFPTKKDADAFLDANSLRDILRAGSMRGGKFGLVAADRQAEKAFRKVRPTEELGRIETEQRIDRDTATKMLKDVESEPLAKEPSSRLPDQEQQEIRDLNDQLPESDRIDTENLEQKAAAYPVMRQLARACVIGKL